MNKKPTFSKVLTDKVESEEIKVVNEEINSDTPLNIQELLQRQVNHEFANERLYLSMALWCEEDGWPETAQFFSKHAVEEERVHGMMVINYMLKKKIKVLTPSNETSKREYTNMREVLTDAVKREEMTSEMVGELLRESIKKGDLAYTIADALMKEQIEEEQLFNSLLNLYDMSNNVRIDFEMEIALIKASDKYKLGKI